MRNKFKAAFQAVTAAAVLATFPAPGSAAFEELAIAARPAGMSSAFTALADDVNALHANPAGLGDLNDSELTAGYGRLFLGLTDDSKLSNGMLGVGVPLAANRKGGSLGFSWNQLMLGGTYHENSYGVSYGRRFGRFSAGVTGKYLERAYSIGSDPYMQADPMFSSHKQRVTALSADVGLLFRAGGGLSFGVMGRNVSQPDVGLQEEDRLEAAWRGGVAWQGPVTVSLEGLRQGRDSGGAAGVEVWLIDRRIGLRGGLEAGSRERKSFSTGLSVRLGGLQLDYAFLMPLSGIETNGTHRLSLSARVGSPTR